MLMNKEGNEEANRLAKEGPLRPPVCAIPLALTKSAINEWGRTDSWRRLRIQTDSKQFLVVQEKV